MVPGLWPSPRRQNAGDPNGLLDKQEKLPKLAQPMAQLKKDSPETVPSATTSRLPLRGWALELARRWNGGSYSVFVLHGNIFDLFPLPENNQINYVPLKTFLYLAFYWEWQWRMWEVMPAPKEEFALTPILPMRSGEVSGTISSADIATSVSPAAAPALNPRRFAMPPSSGCR